MTRTMTLGSSWSWNASKGAARSSLFADGRHDDQVDALSLAFNQTASSMSVLERFRVLATRHLVG
jgi:hypothetical protein